MMDAIGTRPENVGAHLVCSLLELSCTRSPELLSCSSFMIILGPDHGSRGATEVSVRGLKLMRAATNIACILGAIKYV